MVGPRGGSPAMWVLEPERQERGRWQIQRINQGGKAAKIRVWLQVRTPTALVLLIRSLKIRRLRRLRSAGAAPDATPLQSVAAPRHELPATRAELRWRARETRAASGFDAPRSA